MEITQYAQPMKWRKYGDMPKDLLNPTIYETYAAVDENMNTSEFEMAGKPVLYLDHEYENTLYRVEQFMQEVSKGKQAFSTEKTQSGRLKPLALAKYFPEMKIFLDLYSPDKFYSPHVNEFYNLCVKKYNLQSEHFDGNPDLYSPVFKMKQGEFYNNLIVELLAVTSQRKFKRKLYARSEAIVRGKESARKYIDALFQRWSRLLVLRIDFGFRVEDPLQGNTVSLKEAQEHLARFFNNKRGKKLYSSLKGYIWRLEYGRAKGYHFHLIFFLDGSTAHKDEYLASEIGTHWINLTNGKGIYYNCNAHKQKYKRLGIGMISHADEEKRRNLLDVIEYMYKEDQVLREKHAEKTHGWGRGAMPATRTSILGRPRRKKLT